VGRRKGIVLRKHVDFMVVGVCKLDVILYGAHSLKEKRQILRKVKDLIFRRFKVLVSEVGSLDLWQRTELGFALVGNSSAVITSAADKIVDCVNSYVIGDIVNKDFEIINFGS